MLAYLSSLRVVVVSTVAVELGLSGPLAPLGLSVLAPILHHAGHRVEPIGDGAMFRGALGMHTLEKNKRWVAISILEKNLNCSTLMSFGGLK